MADPFSVEIKGLEDVNRMLTDLERKQVPFATAGAINSTAFQMMVATRKEITHAFDRPTSFTVKSQKVEKATKKHLVGRFRLKDERDIGTGNPPARYLQAQTGGMGNMARRAIKGFEKLLRGEGFMPKGMYVVPARGTKLNKFGNITIGKHKKIIAELKKGGMTAKFFAVRRMSGGLPPGIYERSGRGGHKVRAVFIYVRKRPRYKPRLPFDAITRRTFDKHYEKFFDQAFDHAMRTAR